MGEAAAQEPELGQAFAWRWHDHHIAYRRSGTGLPLVFVHSIHAAASGLEWRMVAAALSGTHTCFVVDLLGFGESDRPAAEYSATLYLDLLRDFLIEVVRAPAVLLGSSLGATYALSLAVREPERVRAVVANGPGGVSRLAEPGGVAGGLVESLFRSRLGAVLFNAATSHVGIRFFLKDIYAKPGALTPALVEQYWKTARHPGARFAAGAFVGMRLNCDIRSALPALLRPLLLTWGESAGQTPFKEAKQVQALVPNAQFVTFQAGDLPHEESPAEYSAAVQAFLATLPA
jgi:pimeloyl-ACP methyl ester carboxylesterase